MNLGVEYFHLLPQTRRVTGREVFRVLGVDSVDLPHVLRNFTADCKVSCVHFAEASM